MVGKDAPGERCMLAMSAQLLRTSAAAPMRAKAAPSAPSCPSRTSCTMRIVFWASHIPFATVPKLASI